MSAFGDAFAKARREKGPGATFTFKGKLFTTNLAGEEGETPKRPKARPSAKQRAKAAASKSAESVGKTAASKSAESVGKTAASKSAESVGKTAGSSARKATRGGRAGRGGRKPSPSEKAVRGSPVLKAAIARRRAANAKARR